MTTDNRGIPASFIQAEARDPAEAWPGAPPNFGQPLVPHIATVSGTTGGAGRAYSWADEALRDSRENAEKMRTDCGIEECLEARIRSAALLNYHIAPENENSSEEKSLADEMTRVIKRTKHFAKFRWCMGLARWYGRYAVVPQYGIDWIGGKQRTVAVDWEPRHGDKLVFRYDDGSHRTKAGQVGIRVGGAHTWLDTGKQDYRGNDLRQIESTQHGLVYWLTDKQRRLIVVNKHIIEDGPFEDPLKAGSIHGIGIRDRIYWTWYGMVECLADILCYLERSAFGIEIWTYPANNDAARRRTEDAAKKVTSGGRTVLIVPKYSGENADQFGVQHIEPGLGGVEQAMTIVREYFGHKIKRYILGQTLTSEADATGLGSGVADAHLATFADIIRWDALNDEETLTTDFLRWLQLWNFPTSRGINLRLVIDTDSPDAEKKMKGYESAWGMGARIKEEDVLSVIGASVPKNTDRVLLNPAVAGGPQGMGANFGGIGFNQPQGQRPPLPDSQQEAIKRMADVEKFINGVSLGKIMADRHTYTLNLEEAARHTATPTEAQAKAGNYRKGKTSLHGLTISIENAKGTRRKPEWPELSAHYGYLNRTEGGDGEHIDVFIGPHPESELVFVIDQLTNGGKFDESKVMLGFTNQEAAVQTYLANYPPEWNIGPVTALTIDQFKNWIENGDTTKRIAPQVSKYTAQVSGPAGATREAGVSGVSGLAEHERPVHKPTQQAVAGIRGSRDNDLSGVANELRDVHQRHGEATGERAGVAAGAKGQQQGVLEGQLRLGELSQPAEEQTQQHLAGAQRKADDPQGLGEGTRGQVRNAETTPQNGMASGQSANDTLRQSSQNVRDAHSQRQDNANAALGQRTGNELPKASDNDPTRSESRGSAVAGVSGAQLSKYTFKESEHPRDESGKFTDGAAAEPKADQPPPKPPADKTPAAVSGGDDKPRGVAASFAELKSRHPELAKFSDSPDPLPKAKGGQIAHMTDRQHEIYSDLAKAKSAGNITEEEWKAGVAAIRGMDVPGNQIAAPKPTVKSKLFSAMKRAKG